MFLKSLGGNPRDLKTVVFKGSAEAITALLGGHLDLVVIGAVNAVPHVTAGRMRVLGVGAPQRLGGVLANVPTWREQGLDVAYGSWRSVFAPKGLTAAQTAYWETVLRKATETPEWKADLERNFWTDHFVTGARLRKDIEQEYAAVKAVLVDIGLAK
jgi:putative tricarboxylic transport membrane protein